MFEPETWQNVKKFQGGLTLSQMKHKRETAMFIPTVSNHDISLVTSLWSQYSNEIVFTDQFRNNWKIMFVFPHKVSFKGLKLKDFAETMLRYAMEHVHTF